MNSLWLKSSARVAALILVGFAIVRFWVDYFSSIRTDEESTAGDVVVHHTVEINRSTILLVFAGMLLLVFSFIVAMKRGEPKD